MQPLVSGDQASVQHIEDIQHNASTLVFKQAASTKVTSPTILKMLVAVWLVWTLTIVTLYMVTLPANFKKLERVYPTAGVHISYLLRVPEEVALRELGISSTIYAIYLLLLGMSVSITFIGAGILIFSQRQNDWMALLISFAMIGLGVTYADSFTVLLELHQPWVPYTLSLIHSLTFLACIVTLYVAPTGRLYPRWMWPLLLISTLYFVAWMRVPTLDPFLTSSNPVPRTLVVIPIASGIIAQFIRARQISSSIQRQQLRWITTGATIIVFTTLLYLLIPLITLIAPGRPRLFYSVLGLPALIILPSLGLPLSLTIAVLRYRLWDIDLVLNRSLVIFIVTALLIILFLMSLFPLLIIVERPIALGGAALVVGLLFQPIHHATQRFIDRNFFNIRVDYQSVPRNVTLVGDAIEQNVISTSQGLYGEFQPIKLLAQGGMSQIYLGEHARTRQPVAIKLMLEAPASEYPSLLERFKREVSIMTQSIHPNIVQILAHGEKNQKLYLIMDYIEGPSLQQYLKEHEKLAEHVTISVLKDIADALGYIHQHGVIHRDVKPGNILLKPILNTINPEFPYRAMLTDFGIAHLATDTSITSEGAMVGTLDYISPEQINSENTMDHRADIYSLGILAFQMLTGKLPYTHSTALGVLLGHLSHPPPDIREYDPTLSANIALPIMRAMAKEPEERFDSVADFIWALSLP